MTCCSIVQEDDAVESTVSIGRSRGFTDAALRECVERAEACLSSQHECQKPSGTSDAEKDWASSHYRISSLVGSTKCSLFT